MLATKPFIDPDADITGSTLSITPRQREILQASPTATRPAQVGAAPRPEHQTVGTHAKAAPAGGSTRKDRAHAVAIALRELRLIEA